MLSIFSKSKKYSFIALSISLLTFLPFKKNDVVFDPFLGSGQVAVVSKINERRFCGFEIVTDYYKFAKKRIKSNTYRLKTS